MLNWVENVVVRLVKPLKSTDTGITINRKDAVKLNTVGIGNHTYLTLKMYGTDDVVETVKYSHTTDIPTTGAATVDVAVTRDVTNTGRRSFPVHTCAETKLTKVMLLEIIEVRLLEIIKQTARS